jgi:hypothetical protein
VPEGCANNVHDIGSLDGGARCACGAVSTRWVDQDRFAVVMTFGNTTTPVSWQWSGRAAVVTMGPTYEASPTDHAEALTDLARSDREQDFRDLARMVGVDPKDLDALWAGTRLRLGKP